MNVLSNKTISIGRPHKMPRLKTIKYSTPEKLADELALHPRESFDKLFILGEISNPVSIEVISLVDESGVSSEISFSNFRFKASAGDEEFPEFKNCTSLTFKKCQDIPYSLVIAALNGAVTLLMMYDSSVVNATEHRDPVTTAKLLGIELQNVNGLPESFYKTIFNLEIDLVALANVSIGEITGPLTGQIRSLDLSGVNEPLSDILKLATNSVSIRNCPNVPRKLNLKKSVTNLFLYSSKD